MMRVKSAIFYVDDLVEIAEDFVKLCRSRRDTSGVMPQDHAQDYMRFAIESVTMIALNLSLIHI